MKTGMFTKVVLCVLATTSACVSVKHVPFKDPVDTSTKAIQLQEKQVFSLADMGVYASNKFDAARLSRFERANDSTVNAYIDPENTPINNSPYYAFNIWSDRPQKVYVRFRYPKGYKHRYFPKIRQTSTGWAPLDSANLFYGSDSIVTIGLTISEDTTWVAAQEIVSSADTKKWYQALVANKPYVRLSSVGKSKRGRDLPVLDIYKGSKEQKPVVALLTRQHPPEVTGFFAYQAFLQTLLRESELSDKFLRTYRVMAFPIVNPDGVDLGHWRHNAGGVDTNRDWSRYRQPEIRKIVTFIVKESKRSHGKIILGLDFHSTYHDVFYTNKERRQTALPHFIEDWFDALEARIPDYKVHEAASNSSKPVSKGWFLYGHRAVGITYEMGDNTPKEKIARLGSVAAEEMMNILIKP